MWQRGTCMHGEGRAVCGKGGCVARGECMAKEACMQERRPLKQAGRILLEYILIMIFFLFPDI